MTQDELVDVLVAEIEDGNEEFVTSLRDRARDQLAAGGGQLAPLTEASLNGKTFRRDVRLDCVEVLHACRIALAQADGSAVQTTSLDFSTGL
jgi:hypothetical protein